VGLTASAGISVNKFVAKIASDFNKPNGQKTVRPDEVLSFWRNYLFENFMALEK
jgi:DNA polymerase-4